jgi:SPP1 family predicted phage head-tail adaptor
MAMDCKLTLISETSSTDEIGNVVTTETETVVFCSVQSIGRNEFYNAGQLGLRAQYLFRIYSAEYSGEKIVEYDGHRYGVYRTYTTGDRLELYAAEKVGVQDVTQ